MIRCRVQFDRCPLPALETWVHTHFLPYPIIRYSANFVADEKCYQKKQNVNSFTQQIQNNHKATYWQCGHPTSWKLLVPHYTWVCRLATPLRQYKVTFMFSLYWWESLWMNLSCLYLAEVTIGTSATRPKLVPNWLAIGPIISYIFSSWCA